MNPSQQRMYQAECYKPPNIIGSERLSCYLASNEANLKELFSCITAFTVFVPSNLDKRNKMSALFKSQWPQQ